MPKKSLINKYSNVVGCILLDARTNHPKIGVYLFLIFLVDQLAICPQLIALAYLEQSNTLG